MGQKFRLQAPGWRRRGHYAYLLAILPGASVCGHLYHRSMSNPTNPTLANAVDHVIERSN